MSDRLQSQLLVWMMDRGGARITGALQRRHKGDHKAVGRSSPAVLGIAVEQGIRTHPDPWLDALSHAEFANTQSELADALQRVPDWD
jgi:hypothetical protein